MKNFKKKMSYLKIALFCIIIIMVALLLFISIRATNKKYESFSNSKKENKNFSYYRCENKLLGKITDDIFKENNINQSNNDWNIYVPCGYNNVETELKNIQIKDKISDKYIFGLNGCDTMVSKNKIWESLVNCYGRKTASKLMPESYVLSDINEMSLFKKKFASSKKDIYILKKNIQRKEGLKLTSDYNEIIEAYKENYKVVQKYIRNLYLINGYKVNLRIYLLTVIKNNHIYFYLSKIGKCIYTNKKYNDNDFDFESNITSYHLDMKIYNNNPRNFTELIDYINKDGHNGKYLFFQIELLMTKISYCLSKNFYQSENILGSVSFQLFGCDVIFDDKIHPYLLEVNKGPDMTPRDKIDENMKNSVQKDMFKIAGILENKEDDNSFYLIYNKKLDNN